jgi:serine/threonine protein kinase
MAGAEWQRARAILDSALTVVPESRVAFVDRECGDDAQVRKTLDSILRLKSDAKQQIEPSTHGVVDPMRVGAFRVLQKIGAGGMGEVFLAVDERLGRRIALKRLRPNTDFAPALLLHEARAAALLNHPNIATVHDVVEMDGRLHIVMEYLIGETLANRLRRGALPPSEAVRIATEVARGIAHSHSHRLLHCDLKPGNIFLLAGGAVKILDFGLARHFRASVINDTPDRIETGWSLRAAGTPSYMAPEQLLGAALDVRTDIYGLGIVMREMLTGRLPPPTSDDGPAQPRSSGDYTQTPLDQVIARATEWDPAARWQSAGEVIDALRRPDVAEAHRVDPVFYVRTQDNVRLACTRTGKGTPLVYVRGWVSHIVHMASDENFRALFDGLASSNDVVRYDSRGNGLSDRVRGAISLDDLVNDLRAVFDGCHIDRGVLFATCFGGPIAIEFAVRFPERVGALVIDGSFAIGRKLASRAKRLLLRKGLETLPEAAFLILSYLTNPRAVGTAYRSPAVAREMIDPATAAALYDLAFQIDVSAAAGLLTVPCLILHRTNSSAVPVNLGRELASLIHHSQFIELSGTGHNPWDEDPRLVLSVISDFLREHEKAT